MNIIKRDPKSKKAPSALARAKERLQARKKAAMPPEEQFLEHAECAKTGERFMVIWARTDGQARFTVKQIVRQSGANTSSAAAPETASEPVRQYALSEFEYAGYGCPVCDTAGGLIYCSCSKKFCHGGTYMSGNTERCTVKSCGCDTMVGSGRTHSEGTMQAYDAMADGGKKLLDKSEDQKRIRNEQHPRIAAPRK